MCGEHGFGTPRARTCAGSSPRVRGTPAVLEENRLFAGIIPACAGNTVPQRGIPWRARDHPRVCGEHAALFTLIAKSAGSSPRVRGTRVLARHAGRVEGIIPACAGNTGWPMRACPAPRDHPRVCGEHCSASVVASLNPGSSPRVRGTLPAALGDYLPVGIIPACAGNTRRRLHSILSTRDHPRVCGEHLGLAHDYEVVSGSSPRVRGTPTRWNRPPRGGGIIPACAGNTQVAYGRIPNTRDHPRVCGEHIHRLSRSEEASGSSPRVRGTHNVLVVRIEKDGIIPACAGNTLNRPHEMRHARDHPRVCGEHSPDGLIAARNEGSSPRVRGTRLANCPDSFGKGIIPACAGNTRHSFATCVQ